MSQADSQSNLDPESSRKIAYAHAQIDYIDALGRAKISQAKAEVIEAAARGAEAVARMKQSVAAQLEAALTDFRQRRQEIEREILSNIKRADQLKSIYDGELIDHDAAVRFWTAFKRMFREISGTASEQLLKCDITQDDRLLENYASVSLKHASLVDIPATVTNVVRLLTVLEHDWFVFPRRGTGVWQKVVWAVGVVAGFSREEADQMRADVVKLEAGFYNVWEPLKFATLPDDPAVQQIITAS